MSHSTTMAAPAATSTPASSSLPLSADALKAVADLLGGGEVVAYRPFFAHVFGGATPALLLSQFWFWTNTPTVKNRDGDGWFWKTQKQITQETGLTRRETDTARRKLVALGVLSEDLRGVPATQHYCLNLHVLYTLLLRKAEETPIPSQADPVLGSHTRKKKQSGLMCSNRLRLEVLFRYQGCCCLCGVEEWRIKSSLHMHRLVKGKNGGLYALENTIPVCSKCHLKIEGKSHQEIEEMRKA